MMADIEITVDGGTSKRLLTAGKYCDKNILVTAMGGGTEPEPPSDGKTRLYITLPSDSYDPNLPSPVSEIPLYIQQSVSNGVVIDWGDDSPTETIGGTGKVNTSHTYAKAGDYIISLEPLGDCELSLGWGSSIYSVLGNNSNSNRYILNTLTKCIIGANITSIDNYAFVGCHSLSLINIPDSMTSIGNSAFYYCYSLSLVVIPDSVTSIDNYAFRACYSLSSINIPDSMTSIGNSVFYYCYSLSSINIPKSVTSIDSNAFVGCYGLSKIYLAPTIPPTLSNTNAFDNIPSNAIFYIPVGTLEAYQTATNWSSFANKFVELEGLGA